MTGSFFLLNAAGLGLGNLAYQRAENILSSVTPRLAVGTPEPDGRIVLMRGTRRDELESEIPRKYLLYKCVVCYSKLKGLCVLDDCRTEPNSRASQRGTDPSLGGSRLEYRVSMRQYLERGREPGVP